MQTKDLDGQVSMFGPGLPCGRTCPAAGAVHQTVPPARTSGRSSSYSSELKNRTLMLLDLRPGAGNMLGPYWEYDPAWLGRSGRLNTSACPKGATESSLSQILQDTVPSKYYLSRTACRGILRRAKERGKPLPPQLEMALKLQAGIIRPPPWVSVSELLQTAIHESGAAEPPTAVAASQRNEVRNLYHLAGASDAQHVGAPMRAQRSGSHGERSRSGMSELSPQGGSEGYGTCGDEKQQAFIANCLNPWETQQSRVFMPEGTAPMLTGSDGGGGRNPGGLVYAAGFSANAGSKAGNTSYQEELSPTLKGSQSGGMMPSVLCLDDQGGSTVNYSENTTGTLRAQQHGHQTAILFENHGIDARYKGPLPRAPALSARMGTGGNNASLVLQKPAAFARQRADVFRESKVVSAESARQHKDATDLILQSGDDFPDIQLIRRLVPRECELLQGYPSDWTNLPGASDSARYMALGNSVAIPCVEYLMQGIALVLRTELPFRTSPGT